MERIASDKHAKYQQYAAENESKFVPLAMDNHGAIHKEFADFIAATAYSWPPLPKRSDIFLTFVLKRSVSKKRTQAQLETEAGKS